MNDYAFWSCKQFLENCIMQNVGNSSSLIDAYKLLIEKKAEFDIEFCRLNSEGQKAWLDYNTQLAKIDQQIRELSVKQTYRESP